MATLFGRMRLVIAALAAFGFVCLASPVTAQQPTSVNPTASSVKEDQLLEQMKGDHADEAFDRSIDVHVSRLRQKIESDPRHPRYVKTVRGAGYLLARES